jgi:predicted metal-binding membrane protein
LLDQTVKPSALEQVLRRDRTITLIALLAVSLLAWAYILSGAGMDMRSMSMPGMAMPMTPDWTGSYFALMLAMWSVMMVAMMLPSAAPMILLFATIERRRRNQSPLAATTLFAAAYVAVWLGFSLVATLLQWRLELAALLSPAIASASALFAAVVLIAAGMYQFTPLKQACLRGCRSPLEFISRFWSSGAFLMGLRHGLYCVGCCWMLMLLLFVGGVMNLLWVGLIAAFIVVEKITPPGKWLGYGAGAGLVGVGAWMLYVNAFA